MMACTCQSILSASTFASPRISSKYAKLQLTTNFNPFTVRASSDDDCNDEECAPDKEVGKISMDWVASEKTKVVGTFPPRNRGWTGYVEKDTAGQTNIYSVEPAVYIAESAISSGNAGSSADGAENTAAIAAGIALISVAAAASILLQVAKNPPQVQTVEYNGPSLTYYINKFTPPPPEVVEASAPSQVESAPSVQEETSSAPDAQIQIESENQLEPSVSSLTTSSASEVNIVS